MTAGAVVTQYNYSPFGHTEVIGTDIDQPFRFTGREYDAETGLYYYRARYYSPDMRRFISEDPLRFAAGDVNFYAYVWNNPVNFIDPMGLAGKCPSSKSLKKWGDKIKKARTCDEALKTPPDSNYDDAWDKCFDCANSISPPGIFKGAGISAAQESCAALWCKKNGYKDPQCKRYPKL